MNSLGCLTFPLPVVGRGVKKIIPDERPHGKRQNGQILSAPRGKCASMLAGTAKRVVGRVDACG
jgi:hypothetical protein